MGRKDSALVQVSNLLGIRNGVVPRFQVVSLESLCSFSRFQIDFGHTSFRNRKVVP